MAKKSQYRAIKQNLFKILKYPHLQEIIEKNVLVYHKVIKHTLQFLKLYLLSSYEENKTIPIIDSQLLVGIMKTICDKSGAIKDNRGRHLKTDALQLKEKLSVFYDQYYNIEIKEPLSYKNNGNIIDYLATDIITMYENNIKQRYVGYLERFVNVLLKGKNKYDLRKIKNCILEKKECKEELLQLHLPYIIPQHSFTKDSLYYDIQCVPQEYLLCMIYMMKFIEEKGGTISNVFPLRTSNIPKYIRFDTATIVKLFMIEHGTKSKYLSSIKKKQEEIWELFFRTEMKCFAPRHKEYCFDYMIETDGVGCSILWVKKGEEKKIKKKKSPTEKYIDDIDISTLQGKRIVGIDPNKSDLIYCSSFNDEGKHITYRYTQNQRRKESKTKKFSKQLEFSKKDSFLFFGGYDWRSVEKLETELSNYNRKTLDIKKFQEYCKKKNEVDDLTSEFYQDQKYRKYRWFRHINKKRSEDKMLNRFQEIFGSSEKVVIGFGDWEQKKQMKYKEPTLGKRMRTLFKKRGYQLYLVDEFRTSCQCYNCEGGKCKTFLSCPSPRPWRKDETIICHGLLKCNTCGCLWNRDVNSSLNIHRIVEGIIKGSGRPDYLCRISVSHHYVGKVIQA